MVSIPYKLSVIDGDDVTVSPDFLYHILKDWLYNLIVSISIVQYLDNAQLHTSKASSHYNHFHIILYKIQKLLFSDHSKE